jgi:hypothetical protein
MTTKTDNSDIVNDYRPARARLRLAPYDAWLVEHIARRVAQLLGKCDAEERGGADQGDMPVAGGRAVSPVACGRTRARRPLGTSESILECEQRN